MILNVFHDETSQVLSQTHLEIRLLFFAYIFFVKYKDELNALRDQELAGYHKEKLEGNAYINNDEKSTLLSSADAIKTACRCHAPKALGAYIRLSLCATRSADSPLSPRPAAWSSPATWPPHPRKAAVSLAMCLLQGACAACTFFKPVDAYYLSFSSFAGRRESELCFNP